MSFLLGDGSVFD